MALTTEDREKLKEICSGEIRFDEPLRGYTSIGVGGPADVLVCPGNAEEVLRIVAFLKERQIPFIPLGNGTNLIVREGGFRGAAISMRDLRTIRLSPRPVDRIAIYAEAGAALADVVGLAGRQSLTGLEFCAGIPGSVGGGLRMNAGAYGSELKDAVERITILNGKGIIKSLERAALRFSYRNLDLPVDSVILNAEFHLSKGSKDTIEETIAGILRSRREKHPLEFRSAGSIFKNPPETPAGRIIEAAGLKGLQIGDAQVSEKHGNFIVNKGRARAKDIIDLIESVRQKVFETSGVSLEMEVKIIGEG